MALKALPIGVLVDISPGALVDHSLGLFAMNSLGGLTTFRMLGASVDSFWGTKIAALMVLLDISVVKYTLVIHSGTSGRVISRFELRCSADHITPPACIEAWEYGSWFILGPRWPNLVLNLPIPGARCSFELVVFIPKISRRWYRLFSVASLSAQWSTHSRSPRSFFFANMIGAATRDEDWKDYSSSHRVY